MKKLLLLLSVLLLLFAGEAYSQKKKFGLDSLRVNDSLNVLDESTGDTTLSVGADRVGIGTSVPATLLHIIRTSPGTPNIINESFQASAVGSSYELFLNTTTPALNDLIGQQLWKSRSSTQQLVFYHKISGFIGTTTNGAEDGIIDFEIMGGGSDRTWLTVNGLAAERFTRFNEDAQDWNHYIEAVGEPQAFFLQGSDGFVGYGTATPEARLHLHGGVTNRPDILLNVVNAGPGGTRIRGRLDTVSPTFGDVVLTIFGTAQDAGGNFTDYVTVDLGIDLATEGDESGFWEFKGLVDNIEVSWLEFRGFFDVLGASRILLNANSQNMDFNYTSQVESGLIYGDAANNRVGIGTVSPSTKFHILSPNNQEPIVLLESTNDGTNSPVLEFYHDDPTPGTGVWLGELRFTGDNDIGTKDNYHSWIFRQEFVTDGEEAGNFTYSPLINGNPSSQMAFDGRGATANEASWGYNSDQRDVDFRWRSDDTNQFVFFEGSGRGQVGIGTDTPGEALHILRDATATTSAGVRIESNHFSNLVFQGDSEGTPRLWDISVNPNGPISIREDVTTQRFRIDEGGNIILGDGLTTAESGVEISTSESGTDNNLGFRQAKVLTTDATVTTLFTIAITASRTYFIESIVVARRTGGAAGAADDMATYKFTASYSTKTGTVTLGSAGIQDLKTADEDQAAWDATYTISGTNVLLRITGAINNNVAWSTTTKVSYIGI